MAAATAARGVPRVGAELEPDFEKIVAVDLGTYGSAYCIAFRPRSGAEDPSKIDVNPVCPGDAADNAMTKALTAILLKDGSHEIVAIGAAARRRFAELCDDAGEKAYLYFENFKMHMSPEKRTANPFSAEVTAAGANVRKPLMLPVSKYLQYIRQDAMERISRSGASAEASKIGWVLTVPAIWDDQAKAFMRAAAKEAGMIDKADSNHLLLALEPEGAGIASLLSAAPEVREKFKTGQCILVLDSGGGTVDCTVSEIRSNSPLQLKEVLPASGGPWGGTFVDQHFLTFVSELIGPSEFKTKVDNGSRVELLDQWEETKRKFNPADAAAECRLDFLCVERCLPDGARAVQAAVDRYNTKKGWTGADAIQRTRRGNLVLSNALMKTFFDPLVDSTLTHVAKLFEDARRAGKTLQFILLVGGFAESPYLVQRVRERFGTASVIVPQRPQQVVNRGAAQFGLYPKAFIHSRIARYTYAIAISEAWNPAHHSGFEPRKFCADTGIHYCDYVLRPLVRQGESVEVDEPRVAKGFKAVRRGQLEVGVRIYRTDKPVDPLSVPTRRTVVMPEGTSPMPPGGVPESCKCAEVLLKVAENESVPLEERVVDVSLYFGRTEVVINCTAAKTGESKYITVKYQ